MPTAEIPATRKEEGLWLLERLVPGEGVNNVPGVALRVAGRLDRAVLQEAVAQLVRRYDALRTVFHADDTRLTKSVLASFPVLLEGAECTDVEAGLRELITRPFTLDGSPLLRVGLYHGPEHDSVGVAVHHLIFDGTSMSIFLEDLAASYDAVLAGDLPDAGPPVPLWPESEPKPESLAFWREHLRDFDAGGPGLWCGGQESAQPTLRGEQLVRPFSAAAKDVVTALQKDLKAPDVVVLLAAYYLLLHAHGAGPDLAVGFPVNVRSQQAQRAIGYHVNIVPLRVRIDPAETFRRFSRRVRDLFFEAIAHADVPMDVLLPEVERAGSSWRTTMFRHVFNYLPFGGRAATSLGGAPAEVVEIDPGHSKFDLEFVILPSAEESRVKAVYGAEVLDRGEVELLLERYDALLVAAASAPDRPLRELDGWGATDHAVLDTPGEPAGTETVLTAIARHVSENPGAPAIVAGEGTTSYRDLWRAAAAVTTLLADAGTGPGDVVAVTAPRGPDFAAAILGSWLAGATVTADVFTAKSVLGAEEISYAVTVAVDPDAAAVPPDSVALPGVTHRELADSVRAVSVGARPVLWLSAAVEEPLLALANGVPLVVAPDAARTDGHLLAGLLTRHDVGVVHATPAVWSRVVEQLGSAVGGRTALIGAEPAPGPLVRTLRALDADVHTVFPFGGRWVLADGVPVAGLAADVVAPDGRRLPLGVRGELKLGTATGVLAHWRTDGSLHVHGPQDRQLTFGGTRVDLATVEDALTAHTDVVAAAVTLRPGAADLVAVVQAPDKPRLAADLARHAEAVLPPAARPAWYLRVDALPETAAHEVDRAAVAELAAAAGPPAQAPAKTVPDATTEAVMAMFRHLLKRDDVTEDTNFFAGGGHSLLAAQLVQRIQKQTGVRLKLSAAFAHPTPAALAELITGSTR
ncbi:MULTISPECIES: condensation domain-containing protein [unclassified Amycolatopsis]|uniref:condensation domain-containing protein n=1 Tax=unclassified Amycolatopsis TaxID=2618356 RepID=UPI0028757C68|nr:MULTISPECIES: condensation domain-containing protein [unclassified Amycolatopsis]MDS0136267.1 AMP-binding protein [Amycolatopsis sp. 505]MDS0145782.1 AMP-binding protein [Amycolatopsis sp. CM201R]